ncbi:MAG: hypothetical protein ACE5PV_15465 [Candidatus Poribacteria bacterium]
MWNHEKQARFDHLREREQMDMLTASEREELNSLYQELYALEAATHAPASQRAERKIASLEERNRQLAVFLEEREAFLQRVKKAVEELKFEDRRLRQQYSSLLAEVTLDASSIEVS